jgi:hypothetical protein
MSSVRSGQSYDPRQTVVVEGVARFAGVMLLVVALLEILQGIMALANDSVFVKGLDYTYKIDVTTWGWTHVLIGVVGVAIGMAIITGHTLGYLGGIAMAFVAAVANFAFLPYQPVWSLVIIAFNVLVIWALCKQLGRERVDEGYYAPQVPGSPTTATPGGSEKS